MHFWKDGKMSTHQLQSLMYWTCYLCFGFNDVVIWMMFQEEFHAVIRWWQPSTSRMHSWKCHNILLWASSLQVKHGLCSRIFQDKDLELACIVGWVSAVWILQCAAMFGTYPRVCHSHPCRRHHVRRQPQVLEWVQRETSTAFYNQLLCFGRRWNRNLFPRRKDLACGGRLGFASRQQHCQVDQGLGREVARWSWNPNGGQPSLLGW